MQIPLELALVVGVFSIAGVVKGAIGLGLPTIAMGLLSLFMPPAHAAAALVIPSFVTNVWQLAVGPSFRPLVKRLAPMLGFVCVGVWLGFAVLPLGHSSVARVGLGAALALYACLGLSKIEFAAPRRAEPALSIVVGLATGFITAATGVFVIPAVPYLQALGLPKDELVQALGLSFTVSTIALGAGLAGEGLLAAAFGWNALWAVIAAMAGMAFGQWIRSRIDAATFKNTFFWSLLLLGAWLAVHELM
jgi:uncharacterized membrane protein YfcA